jgi:transposase InsO family protein
MPISKDLPSSPQQHDDYDLRLLHHNLAIPSGHTNALAESVNSSYKTELIDNQPLYPGATELSLATAEWVAFHNRQRPNGYCQDLTPDRAEALYYHRQRHPHTEEALK